MVPAGMALPTRGDMQLSEVVHVLGIYERMQDAVMQV